MPRARRRCPATGCDHLTPCPDHTPAPWASSSRRATLPPDWPTIRAHILERDTACQLAYSGTWRTRTGPASCTGHALEVDHIGAPDDHRPHMLRGVCPPCHRRRTQQQATAARWPTSSTSETR
jgi:hypothetical protein